MLKLFYSYIKQMTITALYLERMPGYIKYFLFERLNIQPNSVIVIFLADIFGVFLFFSQLSILTNHLVHRVKSTIKIVPIIWRELPIYTMYLKLNIWADNYSVLPSTGFEPTPLIRYNTNSLAILKTGLLVHPDTISDINNKKYIANTIY